MKQKLTIGFACYIKNDINRQIHFAKLCADSIRRFVSSDYNLVIVDNGCSEEGSKAIRDIDPDCLIRFRHNMGISYAFNSIINESKTEYLYMINSDNALCKNSVENLLKVLETNKNIGMVGSPTTEWINDKFEYKFDVERGNIYNLFDPLNSGVFPLDKWNDAAQKFIEFHQSQLNIGEFSGNQMIRREVLEKIGNYKIQVRNDVSWNACDVFLKEDLNKNKILYAMPLNSIIYHPQGGMVTSRFVSPRIEDWRIEYIESMGGIISR